MVAERLKESYRAALEQESAQLRSGTQERGHRHRYKTFIRAIEDRILPMAETDPAFLAEVLKDLGELLKEIGEFARSLETLTQAAESFSNLNKPRKSFEAMALHAECLCDASRFAEAALCHEDILEHLPKSKDMADIRIGCLSGIADVYRLTGRFRDSLCFLERALRISRRHPEAEAEADILWVRGYVHIYLGNYGQAMKDMRRVLDAYVPGSADEAERAPTLGAIADIHRHTGRTRDAIALYRKIERTMDLQENRTERPWILSVQALAHLDLGEFREARRCVIRAETLGRRSRDTQSVIWALQSGAELERLTGKTDLAREKYLESRKLAHTLDCRLELAHAHLGLAVIRIMEEKPARRELTKASALYEEMGVKWGMRSCRKLRAETWPTTSVLNFP